MIDPKPLPPPTNPERSKQLFDKYVAPEIPWLRRYAQCLAKNDEIAEEILNDALIKAYRYIDKCDTSLNVKGWLNLGVRFSWINTVRCSYHKRVFSPLNETELSQASFTDSIDEKLIFDEAVSKLSPQHQQMLSLKLQGFSGKEIAGIVGCNLAFYKRELRKIKASLKKALFF
jgi:RNA polymerase sigma-70 factor, ECF subfamily